MVSNLTHKLLFDQFEVSEFQNLNHQDRLKHYSDFILLEVLLTDFLFKGESDVVFHVLHMQ